MPHIDLERVCAIAEKLRVVLAAEPLIDQINITASFGVAQWQPGQDLGMLMKRADKMLYRAKQQGRNRVECQPSD